MNDSAADDSARSGEGPLGESDEMRFHEYAAELEALRPELPEESLGRIRRTMEAEILRLDRRRRAWMVFSGGSLAAAAAVAIGFFVAWLRVGPGPDMAVLRPPAEPAAAEPPVIEDQYRIAFHVEAAPGTPSAPLLPLDDYRSLIGDVN